MARIRVNQRVATDFNKQIRLLCHCSTEDSNKLGLWRTDPIHLCRPVSKLEIRQWCAVQDNNWRKKSFSVLRKHLELMILKEHQIRLGRQVCSRIQTAYFNVFLIQFLSCIAVEVISPQENTVLGRQQRTAFCTPLRQHVRDWRTPYKAGLTDVSGLFPAYALERWAALISPCRFAAKRIQNHPSKW